MQKHLVLISLRYSLLQIIRQHVPPNWNVRVFSSIEGFQNFNPPSQTSFILIDFSLPAVVRHKISQYLQKHAYAHVAYITYYPFLPVADTSVLRFPDDVSTVLCTLKEIERLASLSTSAGETMIQGISDACCTFRKQLCAAAKHTAPVLLTGASGTGKTLAANVIHSLSAHRQEAFYAVNVATIPEQLAEAELFGTVRGAFTDAQTRKGYFASSAGGTLFLDEIGELNINTQAKLLHVLESGVFRSVGSDIAQKSTVRLIFATNVDLKRRIKQRLFRQDLYYRIAKLSICVPSLSERKDDIPVLSRHFLAKHGKRLTTNAELLLKTFHWDGNVRQLHNCLERAALYCKRDIIDVGDLVLD